MDQSRRRRRSSGAMASGSYYGTEIIKKKNKPNGRTILRAVLIAIVLIALIGVSIFFVLRGFQREAIGSVTRIGATLSQNVMPFGGSVLFYDGTTLHCVAATGGNEWSYQIGINADYDAGDKRIVAWSGNDLYILSSKGRLIFHNKMNNTVQFASAGSEYVAVFVGEPDNGVVSVINADGRIVDNITITNQTLLDIGFFMSTTSSSAQETELMWMLGLDTTGTVISTELQTFQPGKLATGKSSLGEHIAYTIYDTAGILNVVDTRQIAHYNYRVNEQSSATLIYGYTVGDVRKSGSSANVLLLPVKEQSTGRVTSVRLMNGAENKVIHIPAECMGAVLGTRSIYAFSQNCVYVCPFEGTTFKEHILPMNITAVLGMISDDRAIVASNSEIYVIELPR